MDGTISCFDRIQKKKDLNLSSSAQLSSFSESHAKAELDREFEACREIIVRSKRVSRLLWN